jgi:glycosyl transferase, family 25
MKIYIINLASATGRYQRMASQLNALNLPYERFDAVNGSALGEEEMEQFCSMEAVRSNPTWLTKGAIGCALSHWGVCKKMLADEQEVALILEDDMVLPPNFTEILLSIEKQIADNEVILLYFQSFKEVIFSTQHKKMVLGKYELAYPMSLNSLGAAGAYIIKKSVAQKFAQQLIPIRAAADTWHYFYEIGIFQTVRCVIPFVVVSSFAESTIDYIKKDNLVGKLKSFFAAHNILFVNDLLKWRRKRIWKKLTKFSFTDDVSPFRH